MPAKTSTLCDVITRECVAVRVRRLGRLVTGLYDRALRPLGLKVSQLNILVAAGKLGVAQPLAVCRALELDASTLSRNVDRMMAKGWLEVAPIADGRAQPFRLTPSGHRLVERAFPAWERAQKKARELLGSDGLRALIATMKQPGT